MRVIPVLDLLDGTVVRGVGGRRKGYQPIVSQLVAGSDPLQVAQALCDRFNFSEFYVADLNAIGGSECGWEILTDLRRTGVKLLVDAGVASAKIAQRLNRYAIQTGNLSGIVVGLESVASPPELPEIANAIDADLRVFSLDLRGGLPLAGTSWRSFSPLDIVSHAAAADFRRLIVLDLADVGGAGGTSTISLCSQIRDAFPKLEVIAGGGVRGVDDLRQLARGGCDAALVASALHDRNLTRGELQELGD